jgi:hypothetical protein
MAFLDNGEEAEGDLFPTEPGRIFIGNGLKMGIQIGEKCFDSLAIRLIKELGKIGCEEFLLRDSQ